MHSRLDALVRVATSGAPLTMRTFRALREMHAPRVQDRLLEPLMQRIAGCVVRRSPGDVVRFGEITADEWPAVRAMRLAVYEKRLPSLLPALDERGQDALDPHSFAFAAWLNGRPVATIRATPYPFETARYVDERTLGAYLGGDWRREYVEWGRLAADSAAANKRIVPALITYGGLHLLLNTPYSKYFGYTRRRVRGTFDGFRVRSDSLTFQIPERGDHDYLVLKGDLSLDLVHALPQWLSTLRARRARRSGGSIDE